MRKNSKFQTVDEATLKEAVSVVGGRLSYLNKVFHQQSPNVLTHSGAGCEVEGYGTNGKASYVCREGMALEPNRYVFPTWYIPAV